MPQQKNISMKIKHILPLFVLLLSTLCRTNSYAGQLTTNRSNMNLYSDEACTKVAFKGIEAGNTYYYEEEPKNGAVKFEFAGKQVYAKLEDVFLEDEDAFAGSPDEDYDEDLEEAVANAGYSSSQSGLLKWLKRILFVVIAYFIYRYAKKKKIFDNSEFLAREAEARRKRKEEEDAVPKKYTYGTGGCDPKWRSQDIDRKLLTLNRCAAMNPGKDTTDPHALCRYLLRFNKVRDEFLKEAATEKQLSAGNTQEWFYVQLRVQEYVPTTRLQELSPVVFELYKTLSLYDNRKTPADKELIKSRISSHLEQIDYFDDEEKIQLYQIVCKYAEEDREMQRNYDYACRLAELGKPFRKEKILKSYKLKSDGKTLDMAAHKRKSFIKWTIIVVIGIAAIAALLLLALYVALICLFAFALYVTFKMMINDATSGWNTPSPKPKYGPNSNHSSRSCGSCPHYDTVSCPRISVANPNDTACALHDKVL